MEAIFNRVNFQKFTLNLTSFANREHADKSEEWKAGYFFGIINGIIGWAKVTKKGHPFFNVPDGNLLLRLADAKNSANEEVRKGFEHGYNIADTHPGTIKRAFC